MTRFSIGFVAGALILALLQFVFGLVPTLETSAIDVDTQRQTSSAQQEDTGRGGNSKDSRFENADDRQSNGIDNSATLSADSNVAKDSAPSENARTGPKNPIELPDTHAGFVDESTPSLPDEHKKVEEEDVDSGWAENVEALIYSFITSHPSGELIQIVSLVCRTTRCEIVGSVFDEQGADIWNLVLSDMRAQPWFSSNFADSMFGSGGAFPGEFRFITILARVGSEIGPPVRQ